MFRMRNLYREVLGRLELELMLTTNTLKRLDSVSVQHRISIVKLCGSSKDLAPITFGDDQPAWLALVKQINDPSLKIYSQDGERLKENMPISSFGIVIG